MDLKDPAVIGLIKFALGAIVALALGLPILRLIRQGRLSGLSAGRDGIKLNVFTSGPAIPPETAAHLFEEGVRGENASGEYGTGHGLYFIREVVRLHGGVEGYEATDLGNNFFFVLPMDPIV